MIKIPVTTEIEITAEEFAKRTCPDFKRPRYSIGEIVEYVGDFGRAKPAMIVEISLRAGGWHYAGHVITPHSYVLGCFSEKDVTRSLADAARVMRGE